MRFYQLPISSHIAIAVRGEKDANKVLRYIIYKVSNYIRETVLRLSGGSKY